MMIPPEAVTMESLSGLLDDAVIDWTLIAEGGLYITSLQVPLWLGHDTENVRITMRTYWPVRDGVDDMAAMRFANQCNATLVMVQFWYDAPRRRLFGQYVLGCRDGLNRRLFIRSLREFAEIFSLAVRKNDEDDLLCEKLSDGSDEETA